MVDESDLQSTDGDEQSRDNGSEDGDEEMQEPGGMMLKHPLKESWIQYGVISLGL